MFDGGAREVMGMTAADSLSVGLISEAKVLAPESRACTASRLGKPSVMFVKLRLSPIAPGSCACTVFRTGTLACQERGYTRTQDGVAREARSQRAQRAGGRPDGSLPRSELGSSARTSRRSGTWAYRALAHRDGGPGARGMMDDGGREVGGGSADTCDTVMQSTTTILQ
eukprot:scaffold175010_cov29-Tisochrysis_lutea.AAC.1